MNIMDVPAQIPEELRSLIEEGDWKALARRKEQWPDPSLVAPEIAEHLKERSPPQRVLLFRALPRELAAEVLSWLDPDTTDDLLLELTDGEARRLLSELDPDDRTALLAELPGQAMQRLLSLLGPERRTEALELLGYPPESVGRLMTPEYVAVRAGWKIERAIEEIRRFGRESETLGTIYVVDAGGRLIDALALQRFVLAPPESRVTGILDHTYVGIQAFEDREEAVRLMQRYDLIALPVVDSAGVLIGIVTIDDAMDVAEAEATEDFHLASAIAPLKRSYWDTGILRLLRSRLGWLVGLLLVNLLSSGVIAMYEGVLAAFVALTFFIPLIIDSGGNTGAQSATLMIRSLSTADVHPGQWRRVLLKEIVIGLGVGFTLGVLGLGLGTFRGGLRVGIVVFLTLATITLITNLFGTALPFIFHRLRLDPALASGPLITSVADAGGLLIYFAYASLILF